MQIHLKLGNSRSLFLALLIFHVGAIAGLWLAEVPNQLRLLASVGVIFSLWYLSALHCFRRLATSVVAVTISGEIWNIEQENGVNFAVDPDSRLLHCYPWLTLMGCRVSGNRFTRWVVVPQDACASEEHRRLRFLSTKLGLNSG